MFCPVSAMRLRSFIQEQSSEKKISMYLRVESISHISNCNVNAVIGCNSKGGEEEKERIQTDQTAGRAETTGCCRESEC